MSAFVFDLDMTLVNSSALAEWRDLKMWSQVRSNLESVKPFSVGTPAPHELPARIKAQGHDVAIVTSSPRWYAEALIELFGIEMDVLVAAGDTRQYKPDPEPIIKALRDLGADPNDAYHIGDTTIDVEASYRAGVTSIGAGWGVSEFDAFSSVAPDILLLDPSVLLRSDELKQRGYFAEMLCAGSHHKTHRGAILPCDNFSLRYTLGRYFKKENPRYTGDALSEKILILKDSDAPAQIFAKALTEFVQNLKWTPDYVIPVPPKRDQSRNRFEAVLEAAAPLLQGDTEIAPNGLRSVNEVEGYKSMGHLERAKAVRGAFEISGDWNNAKILLLDDVLTTGATVAECTRVLLDSDASEVRSVAFGRNQLR